MKRFVLTLPVLFVMAVLAQAQVKLNIKLYPIQTIELNTPLPGKPLVQDLETFGTTHLKVNKLDLRDDSHTTAVNPVKHEEKGQLLGAYAAIEVEQHLADVVYSIEPL